VTEAVAVDPVCLRGHDPATSKPDRMVVVADEWFRSPAWDDAARAAFEARLARARPGNRQQYLRIKGVSLRAAGELDGARELLERAAKHPDGHLYMTVAAWESLADMAAETRRSSRRRASLPPDTRRAAQP
jgi:hypothetical protein